MEEEGSDDATLAIKVLTPSVIGDRDNVRDVLKDFL